MTAGREPFFDRTSGSTALSRPSSATRFFSRSGLPASPKTTFNIGVISGGASVNSIPEAASMRVDLRSASAEQVDRLRKRLAS